MNKYKETIKQELEELAKDKQTVFLGQQTAAEDFYGLLKDISLDKRAEMPVVEELQLSMSLGLALEGFKPVSIFQRMDFLPRACDALVNHLDLIRELSRDLFNPKVLIITTVGSTSPLDVGMQHNKDLTRGFRELLPSILVQNPKTSADVKHAFKLANEYNGSSLLVFYQDLWNE